MRALLIAVCASILAHFPAFAEPDAKAGEQVFRRCKSCHQIGEAAANAIGPNLHAIIGRPAGAVEGYGYSKALTQAAEAGLVWTAERLDAFLADPAGIVPGTKMRFPGIADAKDRQDLVAFLGDLELESRAAENLNDPEVEAAVLAIKGDPEYGEYLASECTSCHREGAEGGIPSIVGWPEAAFVTAMHAYRSKSREHPVMRMVAGRLSYEEIAALAAFFADQE